jgi:hypothetical protein
MFLQENDASSTFQDIIHLIRLNRNSHDNARLFKEANSPGFFFWVLIPWRKRVRYGGADASVEPAIARNCGAYRNSTARDQGEHFCDSAKVCCGRLDAPPLSQARIILFY